MQTWRTYLLVAVHLLAAVIASGQEIDKAQLDAIVQPENRNNLPGFAVRIMKGDELLYASGTGLANVHRQIPMGQTSVINIGSVTKQFTAYAIFLLEERGKLKLSDEIHAYVPELADFGTPITLEQLMAHTSGLRDYPTLLTITSESTNHRLKFDEMIAFLQTHKELNFLPGSRFCYSNTGYMLLAKVVERVSGMSYATFLKQEIFTPLGMSATFVNEGVLLEQQDGTRAYVLNSKKTKAYTARAHRDVVGATGIYSNLEDLAKWSAFLYRHESGMFRKSVIANMETAFRLEDSSSCNYGGGLILKTYRGKPVVEHSGGWGEYQTQCRRFPESGISILIVTNSQLDSPFELCDKLSNVLERFDDNRMASTDSDPGPQFNRLSGVYISEDNIVRRVVAETPSRVIRIYNAAYKTVSTCSLVERQDFMTAQSTRYHFADSAGNELSFLIERFGHDTITLDWSSGSYFHAPRTYVQYPDAGGQLSDNWRGKFYSVEADKTIRIHRHQRKNYLVFVPKPFLHLKLVAIAEGVFQVKGEKDLIRFTETGFVFGNDWVYNLQFIRK